MTTSNSLSNNTSSKLLLWIFVCGCSNLAIVALMVSFSTASNSKFAGAFVIKCPIPQLGSNATTFSLLKTPNVLSPKYIDSMISLGV